MSRPMFNIFDYDPNTARTNRMAIADTTFG